MPDRITNTPILTYIASYTNSQHDIQCRKAQASAAIHALDKVWRTPTFKLTKLKVFTDPDRYDPWSLTHTIENAPCDTYTRMHRVTPTPECTLWHLHQNAPCDTYTRMHRVTPTPECTV